MYIELSEEHVNNGHISQDIVDQVNLSGETKMRIVRTSIKQLPSFENIENLAIIECDIVEIPAMPKLNEIYINMSTTEHIHNSPNLEVLSLVDCQSFKHFPEVDLKKLIIFRSNVERIPLYRNLVHMDLRDMFLNEIPKLDNLVTLRLREVPELRELPPLNNLENLFIMRARNLRNIPSLPKLKVFTLEYTTRLDSLPCFPSLENFMCHSSNISTLPPEGSPLVKLSMVDESRIKIIPDYLTLEKLTVIHCPNMTRVPYLPTLVEIYLENSSFEYIGIVNIVTYKKWRNMVDAQISVIATVSRKRNLGPDLGGKEGLVKYLKPA